MGKIRSLPMTTKVLTIKLARFQILLSRNFPGKTALLDNFRKFSPSPTPSKTQILLTLSFRRLWKITGKTKKDQKGRTKSRSRNPPFDPPPIYRPLIFGKEGLFRGIERENRNFCKIHLVARAIRNAIRANRFARIIRNWNPYFCSSSGRFARITRISDSRESPDLRESCESIRANHATKRKNNYHPPPKLLQFSCFPKLLVWCCLCFLLRFRGSAIIFVVPS